MIEFEIVNIVAYTEIDEKLDLNKIKISLSNCEYEPDIYFALIYRLQKPKLSILVNTSGKIIFTGAKSIEDIKRARMIFFDDLITMNYNPKKRKILFQNMVVISQLKTKPDFQKIMLSDFDIEYNAETFPGMIFRSSKPKFTALIFGSGKISLVGIKKIEDIKTALSIVNKLVTNI